MRSPPPGSSSSCERRRENSTSTGPSGRAYPSASSVASAAAAFAAWWRAAKENSIPSTTARPSRISSRGSPKRRTSRPRRHERLELGRVLGDDRDLRRSSSSSAFARATFSMLPSSSRCTGAIAVMTPTCGRAISASARIWPGPRIPISVTTISVPASARQSVSGTPSSLLYPSSADTTFARCRRSAVRMSFVEVFPTEPVIATTRAAMRLRAARPIAAIAANASSGTSVAAAPRARAWSRYATPPPIATKRSPGPTRRESIWTPETVSASPSSLPRSSDRSSASSSGIRCALPARAAPRARLPGRRRGSCGRRTAVPAPRPCRR